MRAKKKLSKSKSIFIRILLMFLAVIVTVVIFYELTIKERIELAIIAEVKTVSYMAINDAVTDYLSENKDMTNDLFVISSDENNKINSIKENMFSVNMLKTNVSNMSQKYIEKSMKTDGINVKLGNFTGLNILSDVGPAVHYDIDSIPTVSCEVVSSFESTGLNQSVQHISLDVYVDIYVGNPIRIESINFETSFEIAQTVIIGDIPSTYGLISRY